MKSRGGVVLLKKKTIIMVTKKRTLQQNDWKNELNCHVHTFLFSVHIPLHDLYALRKSKFQKEIE